MKHRLPWALIGAALFVAVLAAGWPALQVAKVDGGQFLSHLASLLIFALLLERGVEVFLTIWRAEEAYKREAAVQRLISGGTPATDAAVIKAQEQLIEYRTETQRWALPCTFTLGLLLASFGVRVIDPLVVWPPPGLASHLSDLQLRCLHTGDILFTATLLAGGADPIHKLMDAFRKFLEASSAKASGTANST
jgi:hypothetical protein